jgi:hypothetical protein
MPYADVIPPLVQPGCKLAICSLARKDLARFSDVKQLWTEKI